MKSPRCFELLVDKIFVAFAGKTFQQTVGCPMDINCAHLLAEIFLYSHEAVFIQSLLLAGKKQYPNSISSTSPNTTQTVKLHVSGPNVSCSTWDESFDGEQQFCFLPGFTPVSRERSTVNSTILFPYNKLSIPVPYSPAAAFSSHGFYDMLLIWMFYFGVRRLPMKKLINSNRDTSRNSWNCHLGSSVVDTVTCMLWNYV